MKHLLSFLFLLLPVVLLAQNKDYAIQLVPFNKVQLKDNFWLPRIQTNHQVTIPASFARCKETGRIRNFEMAANHSGKFCTVFPFDDTDIYKTIEGASFSITLFPDRKLDELMDSLIEKIRKAQEPDGYLYTARTIDPSNPHQWAGKERWEKERELSHELYNSGHLYEAAAAHYQATGKRTLLDIALKNADLICNTFGATKKHVAPGHEVVEMGLVKLYRITGNSAYLNTAKYFIEERGHFSGYNSEDKNPWKNGSYWQDHVPVVNQKEAIGHAVRAAYLYSAVADIAALTNDKAFLNAIDTIWNNMVQKKIYVQGGIGAVGDGERFGENYELPNASAYNETCAAIANVYWNHRMFLLHGDSKYIDILEKVLYNGLISGVGMDGKSFFYTNAMEIKDIFSHKDKEASRSGWFTCSCCPTNIVRFIPSVPGYIYAHKDNDIYVNLFVTSSTDFELGKKYVHLEQTNNYPWEGSLKIKVNPKNPTTFALKVRIPGWARNEAMPSDLYSFESLNEKNVRISINGTAVDFKTEKGYAVLSRTWRSGDVIEIDLPMEIRRVIADKRISDDVGKVALQRGPLMYCAEWPDNHGKASNIFLPSTVNFSAEFKKDLLNGVTVLDAEVPAVQISLVNVSTVRQTFTAIPYYAWAHRGLGEMVVWFPEHVKNIDIISK